MNKIDSSSDSLNIKEATTPKKKSTFWHEVKEWIKTILWAIFLYLIISIFGFTARVDGISMMPTFENNQILIASRQYLMGTPTRGDIVVFKSDNLNKALIKRVIGLPGDVIKIENEEVFVNGDKLVETYINESPTETLEYTVPNGFYFVMGDNRRHSMDSRFDSVGAVPFDKIMGTVKLRVFPNPTLF